MGLTLSAKFLFAKTVKTVPPPFLYRVSPVKEEGTLQEGKLSLLQLGYRENYYF